MTRVTPLAVKPSKTMQFDDASFAGKRARFLRTLGAGDDKKLHSEILTEAFHGDNFESNIKGVLANHYVARGHACDDFYGSFLDWGSQTVDESFKERWKVARLNTVGLCGAFALTFVNPVAGMATGFAVSGLAGVAEGVAKRNISSFGHLEDHFAQKMHSAITVMAKDSRDFLTDEAKAKLDELANPKSKTKKSAGARMLSYFSGPVVSGLNSIISRFVDFSPALSGVVGAFIPVLPLLTVALSRKAANLRHESAVAKKEYFDEVVKVVFDKTSWRDQEVGAKKIDELTAQFAQNLAKSDNHGRLPKDPKFHKAKEGAKDKNTNVKKGVTFLPWLGAKVNKFIKRKILKKEVKDIAEYPASGVEYVAFASSDERSGKTTSDLDLSITPPLKEEVVSAPVVVAGPVVQDRVHDIHEDRSVSSHFAMPEEDSVRDVERYSSPGAWFDGIAKTPIVKVRAPVSEQDSEAARVLRNFQASVAPFQARKPRRRFAQDLDLEDIEGDDKASSSVVVVGPASNLSGLSKGVPSKNHS